MAGGTGLQGMTDRLEAVGGSLLVESAVGSGTTVIGAKPAADAPTPDFGTVYTPGPKGPPHV